MMCIQVYVLLLAFLACRAAGFSPSHAFQFQQSRRLSHGYVSRSRLLGSMQQKSIDDIADGEDVIHGGDDPSQGSTINLTALERARILSYRTALGASALLISIQSLGDASILEGTGVNVDGVLDVVGQAQTVLPMITGAALVLCPVPEEKIVQMGTKTLGALAIANGLLATAIPDQTMLAQSSWALSILALMAVSIREIYYFGFEYKQECGIALVTLPLMLDLSHRIPFTVPLCGLGLGVLAAGKIFEPLREDLVRSNSEFLAK